MRGGREINIKFVCWSPFLLAFLEKLLLNEIAHARLMVSPPCNYSLELMTVVYSAGGYPSDVHIFWRALSTGRNIVQVYYFFLQKNPFTEVLKNPLTKNRIWCWKFLFINILTYISIRLIESIHTVLYILLWKRPKHLCLCCLFPLMRIINVKTCNIEVVLSIWQSTINQLQVIS